MVKKMEQQSASVLLYVLPWYNVTIFLPNCLLFWIARSIEITWVRLREVLGISKRILSQMRQIVLTCLIFFSKKLVRASCRKAAGSWVLPAENPSDFVVWSSQAGNRWAKQTEERRSPQKPATHCHCCFHSRFLFSFVGPLPYEGEEPHYRISGNRRINIIFWIHNRSILSDR